MVGGEVVHASGPFAALAPATIKPMPDWLPVNIYGGYQHRRSRDTQQASVPHGAGCYGTPGAAPIIIGDKGLGSTNAAVRLSEEFG
jgi:hypothetical protein